MLNWHFFASQFLCPYFSCLFLPVGIPFIPSSILEACSQIPFQNFFARLLSLPICCGKTSSPPHYSSLLLFSVLVPISVHLSWTGVSKSYSWYSCQGLVVQLKLCQFLLEIPLGGSYLYFHGYVAFELIVMPWLAQAFHPMSSHLLTSQQFSPQQPWLGLRKCFVDCSLLLSHFLLWSGICCLPFHPLQRALLSLFIYVCYSRKYIYIFHDVHMTSLQCLVG